MSVVTLRLGGPMQSWGSSSRFTVRRTNAEPTRSGVIGMVAAALGYERTDSLDPLRQLRFGVRADQPGKLLRDFHTVQTATSKDGKRQPLAAADRHYLADGIYLAALEGDEELVGRIDAALRRPQNLLFLGRRSCSPDRPVAHGVRPGSLEDVLTGEPWLAGEAVRRRHDGPTVRLDIVRDVLPGEDASLLIEDTPISFDPHHRRYAWRPVVREHIVIAHPDYDGDEVPHDVYDENEPMSFLEEVSTCS